MRPLEAEVPFFVPTDEHDLDALRKFAAASAVLISDLLMREVRQRFGWPLMFADVMAVVEQHVLSSFGRDHEYAREPWRRPTDYRDTARLIDESFRARRTCTMIMRSFYEYRNGNEDTGARCL